VIDAKQEDVENLTTKWRIMTQNTSVPNSETDRLTTVDSSKIGRHNFTSSTPSEVQLMS
jgi:hypothetical protein